MTYQVKATRRSTGETWLIYDGATFDKQMAEIEARACNESWPDISYEVVPAPVHSSGQTANSD